MSQKQLYSIIAILSIVIAIYTVKSNFLKNNNIRQSETTLRITTSFYPLYFFASQIAGDKAQIYNITPSGAEPHDYEPTARDIANIEDSNLLILNGGKFESWGEKIKEILSNRQTKIISVGDALELNKIPTKNNKNILDNHTWLNPELAKKEVMVIAQKIEEIDPFNADYYQSNAKTLNNKLDLLDQMYRQTLSNCQKRDIITSHDAFGYIAQAYNFNQISIAGLSPEEEPSPKKLAEISDFAKKNDIEYIFFESLVSPKLSETIAREAGAQTLILNPIEGLSEQEIINGKNYFTEMENNLVNLKLALQCK